MKINIVKGRVRLSRKAKINNIDTNKTGQVKSESPLE